MKEKHASMSVVFFALFLVGFSAVPHDLNSDNGILYVEGKGYPPIKSEDAGQARLMARRAGVLDAYRNILLLLRGRKEHGDDDVELAVTFGFIRGAQVVDEVLLSDGGIRVRIAYPLSEEELASFGVKKKPNSGDSSLTVRPQQPAILSGPVPVNLETWIEQLKKEREKTQKAVPVVPRSVHEVRGVHPVTLEQWIGIIKGMKK